VSLQVAPERVISNLAEYGNTSAASIPLALDEAVRGGSIQPGDTARVLDHAICCILQTA
jgi:3-oxoacyl-[acyl-carrier-protein] synthase III